MLSEVAIKKLNLYIDEIVKRGEFCFSDSHRTYKFIQKSLVDIVEKDYIIDDIGKSSKYIRMLSIWAFIRLYKKATGELEPPTYEEYSSKDVFTPCYYALGDTDIESTHNEYLAVEALFKAKTSQAVVDLITNRDMWSYRYVNLKRIQDYIRLEYRTASKYHRKRLKEANQIAVEQGNSADLKQMLELVGINMNDTDLLWHECSTNVVMHAIREYAKSRENIGVFHGI